MTEYAIPLDAFVSQENGVSSGFVPADTQPDLPRVDPVRRVFITSRNTEIQLSDHPISALLVERIQSQGRPKIPMIEVTLLGKHKQLEPFPSHEGYVARLREWEAESQMALMQYLFVVGVKGQPPQEFVDEQATFFPNATDMELKYLWVASILPEADLGNFTEAIMGQTLTTNEGLKESADSFRSPS